MNHSHLKAFLFVADCGSIFSAAKELFITSTSLLQQINLLEQEGIPAVRPFSPRGISHPRRAAVLQRSKAAPRRHGPSARSVPPYFRQSCADHCHQRLQTL